MTIRDAQSQWKIGPGVDVPVPENLTAVLPSAAPLRGFYFDSGLGDAIFIPDATLMELTPRKRLGVIDGLLASIEQVRLHALVELFRDFLDHLAVKIQISTDADAEFDFAIRAFLAYCADEKISLPGEAGDMKAILCLHVSFNAASDAGNLPRGRQKGGGNCG